MAQDGNDRTDTPDQEVQWLTPAPDGTTVELLWPEDDGPFLLTCHLAQVDGRVQLVGMDLRSFRSTASGVEAGPVGLSEVNHAAVRSLRVNEIAEAARMKLAAELLMQSKSRRLSAEQRQEAAARYETLTSRLRPPVTHRPASSQLEKVAGLYRQALAGGGELAKKPALYVHMKLTDAGEDITLNTVRGQIFRAQQKGLIPKIRD